MSIKNSTLVFLFALVGGFIGFSLCWLYFNERMTDSSEAIVGSEIALLHKIKNQQPNCDALSSKFGIYAQEVDGVILVWRTLGDGKAIEKIAIDEKLLAVSDTIQNACP